MSKAIASARQHAASSEAIEALRVVIVTGCALALVLAGPVLPF